MTRSYEQRCPIAMTLDLIGDRWTLLVIRDIYFGSHRFSDLLASSPGMSTKILAERLKVLEAHGLIERAVYNEHPPRAEYHLTERGLSLEPVLGVIAEWGLQHLVPPRDAEAVRAKINARRDEVAARPTKKTGAAAPAS